MTVWLFQQQAVYDSTKEEIQRPAVPRYFDSKAPIIIQVDASTAGISAALLQNDMPVAFVSKTILLFLAAAIHHVLVQDEKTKLWEPGTVT